MATLTDALDRILALIAGGTKQDAHLLRQAASHLTTALEPAFWVDGTHLQAQSGHVVFDNESAAINDLLLVNGLSRLPAAVGRPSTRNASNTSVVAIVTSIAQSAQILAATAIDDATAASRSHDIADAQNDLSAGEHDFSSGDYRGTISQFEDAWTDLERGEAVGHAEEARDCTAEGPAEAAFEERAVIP
jgi:hypothetical protein